MQASFKKAIAKAQEFGLKAYVSNNQLVVTNKSGRVVGRANADKSVAYKAAGYSEMIDIAAMICEVSAAPAPVAAVNTSAGYAGSPKNYWHTKSGYEFDGIE